MSAKTTVSTIAGTLVCVLSSVPALSQPTDMRSAFERLSGTLSVTHTPMMSAGSLVGCTLVFEHLQRDDLYSGGNFVKLSGSLGIMTGNGNLGFALKGILNQVDPDNLASTAMPIERIYLVGPNYETNVPSLVSSFPTDATGGILSVYELDPSTTMLLDGLSAGSIVVAVGPEGGSSDIQSRIDFSVVETDEQGGRSRSADARLAFHACVEKIIQPFLEP